MRPLLVLAPLGLHACAAPPRSLDPDLAIPPEERIVLLARDGIEVVTAPTIRRPPNYIEATFCALDLDGGAEGPRITEFSVATWIDLDGNGELDPPERGRFDGLLEPDGTRGGVLQVVTPFEPGETVRFQVRIHLDDELVETRGELAF